METKYMSNNRSRSNQVIKMSEGTHQIQPKAWRSKQKQYPNSQVQLELQDPEELKRRKNSKN